MCTAVLQRRTCSIRIRKDCRWGVLPETAAALGKYTASAPAAQHGFSAALHGIFGSCARQFGDVGNLSGKVDAADRISLDSSARKAAQRDSASASACSQRCTRTATTAQIRSGLAVQNAPGTTKATVHPGTQC